MRRGLVVVRLALEAASIRRSEWVRLGLRNRNTGPDLGNQIARRDRRKFCRSCGWTRRYGLLARPQVPSGVRGNHPFAYTCDRRLDRLRHRLTMPIPYARHCQIDPVPPGQCREVSKNDLFREGEARCHNHAAFRYPADSDRLCIALGFRKVVAEVPGSRVVVRRLARCHFTPGNTRLSGKRADLFGRYHSPRASLPCQSWEVW